MNHATDNRYDTLLGSAISAALKEPMAAYSLPSGFAERLVAQVKGAPVRSRLPRWLKRAACFALLLSGAAFAATVVVEAVIEKEGEAAEGTEGTLETEGTDGGDALAASAAKSDVPYVPDVASVPSDEQRPKTSANQQQSSNNQFENQEQEGENKMNIKQKAAFTAAAVTVAGLAPPAAAELASATSSAMASFSSFVANSAQTPTSLEGGFHSFVSQSVDTDALPRFDSREPRGTILIFM